MAEIKMTQHYSGRPLYALPISRDILQLFFKLTQSHVMARHHAAVDILDDGNVVRIGGINGVLVTFASWVNGPSRNKESNDSAGNAPSGVSTVAGPEKSGPVANEETGENEGAGN